MITQSFFSPQPPPLPEQSKPSPGRRGPVTPCWERFAILSQLHLATFQNRFGLLGVFSPTNFVQRERATELDLFSHWDKLESIHWPQEDGGGSPCSVFYKPDPYRAPHALC